MLKFLKYIRCFKDEKPTNLLIIYSVSMDIELSIFTHLFPIFKHFQINIR